MWSTRSLLTLLFIGLSAFSTASMTLATHNYLEFFPAMDKLTARIATIEIRPENQDIRLLFILQNPSGYSGLGFDGFQVSVTFQKPDGTSPRPYGSIQSAAQGALPPHAELRIPGEVPMQGYWNQTLELLSQGQLLALFQISISLTSFLDSVAEVIIHLDCPTVQSPVNCQRSGVDVVPPTITGGGA